MPGGPATPTTAPAPSIARSNKPSTAEISQRLAKLGIVPGGLPLEQTEAALKKERDAYAAAIKVAGIEPQ